MRRFLHLLVPALLAGGLLASNAAASQHSDQSLKMTEYFTSPNGATNSDLAFWGNHAFVGYYSNSVPLGGVRIFDISDPAAPVLVRDFACDGLQADPIVWDRNGNGVADLLLLAVDRTMANPACGAARAAHGDPLGWEGVRVFEMSDDPSNPFTTITQVQAVYTDCGAHTITAWPKDDGSGLLVYVSSYPLRPGPTCGDTEHLNLANPYDADPGLPANPLHGVIQVVDVPFANPAAAQELPVQPAISYPGDPDGKQDWCERGLCAPGVLEDAAIACHDIVVHVAKRLAAGACAEQGQVWPIDANGIPQTQNPISIADDQLSSGGTGQIPGAVDFFHSAVFDNDATVVNWVDESFGNGCPPMTNWNATAWHPAGTHKTGKIFFTDLAGTFLSEFHVGDLRPNAAPGEYCSGHMGLPVPGIQRDLLVNAWYSGGVNVIDFSKPTRLKEVAFYDPAMATGTWSAYPYTGTKFKTGPGMPIYASDGVLNNPLGEGLVAYRTILQNVGSHTVDHLNPQTMD